MPRMISTRALWTLVRAGDFRARVRANRDGAAAIRLHLATPRGRSYVLTAPGDLGMARAYVAGDLVVEGVHPGDPYDLSSGLLGQLRLHATPS